MTDNNNTRNKHDPYATALQAVGLLGEQTPEEQIKGGFDIIALGLGQCQKGFENYQKNKKMN